MRGATDCAKRVKAMFNQLRNRLGRVALPAVGEPVTQLLLGILSRDVPESKALEGLERLKATVVDYNELRVIPPIELTQSLEGFPDQRLKAEDISRALNAIFAKEHAVSLERVVELSRKDAALYLEGIDGLEPYTVARIRLVGLQHHALPLDEAMWALCRQEGLVNARATLTEAQQFLERQIKPEDALEFWTLLRRHAWAEMGAVVRSGNVERICSVPPDRTTRNMLQDVASGAGLLPEPELDFDADDIGGELPALEGPAELTPTKAKAKIKPKKGPPAKPAATAKTNARSRGERGAHPKPKRSASGRAAQRSATPKRKTRTA